MSTGTQKTRLDILLVEKGFFETRQKAQSAIMAGIVFINGNREDKSGSRFNEDVNIEIKGNSCIYVSRGGLKLEKAIKEFNIDLINKVCIDAGASSGGFTDCLLQHGAAFVYAVDVGYGQIAWKLRNDPRVKVLEKCNIRHLSVENLYDDLNLPKAQLCTMDLSFISVTKVLENITNLMADQKEFIILIKPQFEAGRNQVPKTGVIKDKKIHFEVIKNIFSFVVQIGLIPLNLAYSPIKGPSGNIEYLTYATNQVSKQNLDLNIDDLFINTLVELAFQELK